MSRKTFRVSDSLLLNNSALVGSKSVVQYRSCNDLHMRTDENLENSDRNINKTRQTKLFDLLLFECSAMSTEISLCQGPRVSGLLIHVPSIYLR